MAQGMLGQFTLEGKLVPRDIQEAVNLIGRASAYDFNARMQVVRLLAEYPETRISHPKRQALRPGRGTRRTRRDERPDRAETLGKRPVSGLARSL